MRMRDKELEAVLDQIEQVMDEAIKGITLVVDIRKEDMLPVQILSAPTGVYLLSNKERGILEGLAFPTYQDAATFATGLGFDVAGLQAN